jgi:hypothetical protein
LDKNNEKEGDIKEISINKEETELNTTEECTDTEERDAEMETAEKTRGNRQNSAARKTC